MGLNPCCYGRWSQRKSPSSSKRRGTLCLNPCCYGRWSQSLKDSGGSGPVRHVLILVVMEDGLRVRLVNTESGVYCLNPCCYGRWSQKIIFGIGFALICICVLILVVMEDGLRGVSWQLDRKFKS